MGAGREADEAWRMRSTVGDRRRLSEPRPSMRPEHGCGPRASGCGWSPPSSSYDSWRRSSAPRGGSG
ncbi:hypothetical protein SAM23877_2408 [Streptomyces ambofaciens ATCC 23877]|uniref:Uncharacterized protein n=1 Tax=Streptomyces ambofaciens (strain ATCC 23877 / 3486 / DSM 40053 / JCM 4204 / NBRC 12836 / NRRL B-2516) TaxID=278992 RepID=A0A0K2ARK5_STRA7|nr:hypothetical protein SAM23877_2408 [Streptomyces ambofaciens ATCC 23877]